MSSSSKVASAALAVGIIGLIWNALITLLLYLIADAVVTGFEEGSKGPPRETENE